MLKYRPMTEVEFENLIVKLSFEDYVRDIEVYKEEFIKHFDGITPRQFAENQFKEALTSGVNSPNHTFWIIMKEETNEEVGFVWFTILLEKKLCLLSDIYVYERFRGQGNGTRVLHDWENHIKNTYPEVEGLYLSVFQHNSKAKKLYERLGFKVTQESFGASNMIKSLNHN